MIDGLGALQQKTKRRAWSAFAFAFGGARPKEFSRQADSSKPELQQCLVLLRLRSLFEFITSWPKFIFQASVCSLLLLLLSGRNKVRAALLCHLSLGPRGRPWPPSSVHRRCIRRPSAFLWARVGLQNPQSISSCALNASQSAVLSGVPSVSTRQTAASPDSDPGSRTYYGERSAEAAALPSSMSASKI